MLKLPYMRGARWVLAGSILLGVLLVMLASDEPGTVRNGGEPEKASSAVNGEERSGGTAREGLDARLPTPVADPGPIPVSRQLTPDPEKSPAFSGETALRPAEAPYLSAGTTGPGVTAESADTETVNVGDYIDPEGFVTDMDNTVVQVGEYLDPDADVPGD